MKQPYIEPETSAYSLELEMGILTGSNEEFHTPTPGTWGLLNNPPVSF